MSMVETFAALTRRREIYCDKDRDSDQELEWRARCFRKRRACAGIHSLSLPCPEMILFRDPVWGACTGSRSRNAACLRTRIRWSPVIRCSFLVLGKSKECGFFSNHCVSDEKSWFVNLQGTASGEKRFYHASSWRVSVSITSPDDSAGITSEGPVRDATILEDGGLLTVDLRRPPAEGSLASPDAPPGIATWRGLRQPCVRRWVSAPCVLFRPFQPPATVFITSKSG